MGALTKQETMIHYTFQREPICIPSRELDEAVEASVTHLLLHLGEG